MPSINYKAKKKFGQNFLKDNLYIAKIVESVSNITNLSKNKIDLIEIGPGLGDLSDRLLDYYDNLIAYEIDGNLCNYLKAKFPSDRLKLYKIDVLEIKFDKLGWLNKKPYLLVSNLPYYIATKIIVNALKDAMCKGLVVMTQKEVAEKFCANVASKNFSFLSVLSQTVSNEIKLIANVPSSAFYPMPKVESSIFSIYKCKFNIDNKFEQFLRDSFSSPRKKIYKNLSHIKNINEILHILNIDSNSRPHQIATFQYHQIFNNIKDVYGRK